MIKLKEKIDDLDDDISYFRNFNKKIDDDMLYQLEIISIYLEWY
jgi:hypothetical protein